MESTMPSLLLNLKVNEMCGTDFKAGYIYRKYILDT